MDTGPFPSGLPPDHIVQLHLCRWYCPSAFENSSCFFSFLFWYETPLNYNLTKEGNFWVGPSFLNCVEWALYLEPHSKREFKPMDIFSQAIHLPSDPVYSIVKVQRRIFLNAPHYTPLKQLFGGVLLKNIFSPSPTRQRDGLKYPEDFLTTYS